MDVLKQYYQNFERNSMTCNQCGTKMDTTYTVGYRSRYETNETVWFWSCQNPACPNYALLQVPQEMMPKQDGYVQVGSYKKEKGKPVVTTTWKEGDPVEYVQAKPIKARGDTDNQFQSEEQKETFRNMMRKENGLKPTKAEMIPKPESKKETLEERYGTEMAREIHKTQKEMMPKPEKKKLTEKEVASAFKEKYDEEMWKSRHPKPKKVKVGNPSELHTWAGWYCMEDGCGFAGFNISNKDVEEHKATHKKPTKARGEGNPFEAFIDKHVEFDEKGRSKLVSAHGLSKLLKGFYKEVCAVEG